MKILYITPDMKNSGGIARVVSLKTNYLVSVLNYDISVLTVDENKSNFFYEFDPNIKWYTINKTKSNLSFLWRYISLIRKTISQKKPDIVIVCDAVLWILIPWIGIKSKTKIVFETHVSISLKTIRNNGFFNILRFQIILFLKKITIKRFDQFIVLTNEGLKEWNVKNAKVISNPVSFFSSGQSNLENKKAIAVCRHSYEKGIDQLLEVWRRIIEKYPEWILDIYGKWNDDLLYQKMANDLGISENVKFFAPVQDIQKSYEESSFLVMTSRSEAFGMVLIEAMNCGLPCIAYDCPIGPKEIIQNNENGFLIEDGNIDSFLEKLELLIASKNLRIKMGKKAKKTSANYEIKEVMKIWTALFESLNR